MLDTMQSKANMYLALEEKYGAHNYHPLPVVLNVLQYTSSTQQNSQLENN